MACNMMDGSALEGVQAFIEKRAPEWAPSMLSRAFAESLVSGRIRLLRTSRSSANRRPQSASTHGLSSAGGAPQAYRFGLDEALIDAWLTRASARCAPSRKQPAG